MSNINPIKNTKSLKKPVKSTDEVIVVLPDIRSAYNVGSIFRTADAAGVSKIYLSGYSPSPINRFGKDQPQISKTALGAEKSVSWEYFKTHAPLFKKLKKDGFKIVAVEQTADSIDYRKINKKQSRVAFVFGNEVGGLAKSILKYADHTIEIPMRGEKESMNVSVTAGIILYEFLQ